MNNNNHECLGSDQLPIGSLKPLFLGNTTKMSISVSSSDNRLPIALFLHLLRFLLCFLLLFLP
jgi:hypothetical protein